MFNVKRYSRTYESFFVGFYIVYSYLIRIFTISNCLILMYTVTDGLFSKFIL